MAENVKVAVRVRPFNDREKKRNATLILNMSGNSTEIQNPEDMKSKPRKFAFDFSYWSHDGFKERSDGYLEPAGSKYADQKKVFDDLGKGVLENAWKGYNTSLFAYGQTGSGKSYSMMGYGTNKGIVPITCDALFEEISKKKGGEAEYQVEASMLEIYNEQVRDLLNPKTMKIKGGLKVRQHPKLGFYVDQLTSHPVNSYAEIDNKMNEGFKNRTVASTNMNATSSRAHTIVAIKFTQKSGGKNSMTKTSVMNLVDLAGSERAESTGATGDRLKEGSAINQSLSSLGNCIKALADISEGKTKVIVPFRDSTLTRLLKNALGGNSKTIMIAALSPADINYEETLSTLRFADRAKAIKTKAEINESPTDKLIRELKEENDRLMKMLKNGGQMPAGGDGGDDANTEELMRKNQEEMEAMQRTWEEKLKEKEKEYEERLAAEKNKSELMKTVPHLWNLNEDASLCGMITHFCNKGKNMVGSGKESKADIVLTGLGIQDKHAEIVHEKDKVSIKPFPGASVRLNGNEIKDKKELHHNDRLLLGSNLLFVLHHPVDYAKQQKSKKVVSNPTYETAQEEIAKNSGLAKLTGSGKSKDDLLLQEDLIQIWPMVSEANAMSEELDKKTKFEITLIAPVAQGKKEGRTEVCVKMKNMESGNEFVWDRNTFINRKYLMQEMYQNFVNGDADWDLPKDKDPFWDDPCKPQRIGLVHVYLQSLAYQVDLEENLTITDTKGQDCGHLEVKMDPCTKSGGSIGDDWVDDPSELVGKEFHFKVHIPKAMGINKKYAKTCCKFRFYLDDQYTVTNEVEGINPAYNFNKQFSYNPCTKQLIEYLENEALVVEVWGQQRDDGAGGSAANLNTKELMNREKTSIGGGGAAGGVNSHHYKMAAEANTYKRRMERAEAKLKKIKALCDTAKKSKKDVVKNKEVEKLLEDQAGTNTKGSKTSKKS